TGDADRPSLPAAHARRDGCADSAGKAARGDDWTAFWPRGVISDRRNRLEPQMDPDNNHKDTKSTKEHKESFEVEVVGRYDSLSDSASCSKASFGSSSCPLSLRGSIP